MGALKYINYDSLFKSPHSKASNCSVGSYNMTFNFAFSILMFSFWTDFLIF